MGGKLYSQGKAKSAAPALAQERAERLREDVRKEREMAAAGGLGLSLGRGGYGGGSGPLRDDRGNVVADLNQVMGALQFPHS